MAEKVLMLALSPTMEVGTIAKWTIKEGDEVANGDIICEVETDKATMDYEAMVDGTLLKIVLPEGGQAKVGETIAIVGEKGEDFSDLLVAEKAVEKPAEAEPKETPAAVETASPVAAQTPAVARTESSGKVIASPLARKLAGDNGMDIRMITGSGPGGRVVKRDIEKALASGGPVLGSAPGKFTPTAATAEDEVIPVSQKRAVIARRLAESKYNAPHYYLKLSIQMDDMLAARQNLNRSLKDQKVSVNAFLMKFAAEALKRHSQVNSTWNGDHILKHGSIDIGLAVAQEDGLITPVVKNCGNKGILEIESDLKELIEKALNNRLTPEEYSGATFTISNLGSFGIEEFTAIINPPGSAIMAVGKTTKTPVVVENDEIEIQSLMKVTLSCDHRIVDGAVGARFLSDLKEMIENPIRTLY